MEAHTSDEFLEYFFFLAASAYEDDQNLLETWSCGTPCSQVEIMTHGINPPVSVLHGEWYAEKDAFQAYVANMLYPPAPLEPGTCVVSFRGSEGLANWLCDFDFVPCDPPIGWNCPRGSKLHPGFLFAYHSLESELKSALCNRPHTNVVTVGHSLGGALSIMAAEDLSACGYNVSYNITFEAPSVGNEPFHDMKRKFITSRVTNGADPVVQMYPHFMHFPHIGTEVHFEGNLKAVCNDGQVCPLLDEDCAKKSACSGQHVNPTMWRPHDHCNFGGTSRMSGSICNATQTGTPPSSYVVGLAARIFQTFLAIFRRT